MIGILDSSGFGLAVYRLLKRHFSDCSMIYLGDTKGAPFGDKSDALIRERSEKSVRFLLDKGARAVLILSDTLSSIALADLKAQFSTPVFGTQEPLIQKIRTMALKKAVRRVGVLGSDATCRSRIHKTMAKDVIPLVSFDTNPCKALFPFVELGWGKRREAHMLVKKYLLPFKQKQVDGVILASSYLLPLKALIQEKAGKRIWLLDSMEGALLSCRQILDTIPGIKGALQPREREEILYFSDVSHHVLAVVKMQMGERIKVEKALID